MVDLASRPLLEGADGVTSPLAFAMNADGTFDVCMRMAPDGIALLRRMAEATHTTVEDVISKAFGMYQAAVEAHGEGKAVGIAPTADGMEVEFVGFEPPADA